MSAIKISPGEIASWKERFSPEYFFLKLFLHKAQTTHFEWTDLDIWCLWAESTKRGISGSRIPRKVLLCEEGFAQKSRTLSRVPELSETIAHLQSSSIAIM